MTNQHPIIPPPELVERWADMLAWSKDQVIFTQAAQWGADQELKACIEEVQIMYGEDIGACIRDFRRPKPPSLKEQALLSIDVAVADDRLSADVANTIRRALKALPND
jgi:hypothetical protein